MDPTTTPSSITQPDAQSGGSSGDRLGTFRRLFLVLAAVALTGMTLVRIPELALEPMRLALMGGAATMIVGGWILGHRAGRFPHWLLPLELLLLISFMFGLRDALPWLGAIYMALQFRGMYGTRRDAAIVTTAYIATYLAGSVLVLGLASVVRLASLVQVFALGFGAYVVAALALVLRRDSARADALSESELRFRSVTDCLREALLITDTDDRILLANERVREVLGYEPSEVIGKIAGELLLPESGRDAFIGRLRQRMQGESELYEVELVHKDGHRIFAEVSGRPYRGASGKIIGTLGAISDVTDRKRLEARLGQAMRLEAVGQLAGGVAHDFNNLLTVIKCHTELMSGDLDPADPIRISVDEIGRAANRGAALTQQLLAFSRKQLLRPRIVALSSVVTEALPVLGRLAGDAVQISSASDDTTGRVLADPHQLENVLVTLVRNARDAMPAGGRILIETRAHEHRGDAHRAGTLEMPIGRYAMLSVADTGHGMDTEILKRLFEPFFTTKEQGEGIGLGLASMYGIIRQSGGFVDVESAPGKGTTFRIYLPYAVQRSAAEPGALAERRFA